MEIICLMFMLNARACPTLFIMNVIRVPRTCILRRRLRNITRWCRKCKGKGCGGLLVGSVLVVSSVASVEYAE